MKTMESSIYTRILATKKKKKKKKKSTYLDNEMKRCEDERILLK